MKKSFLIIVLLLAIAFSIYYFVKVNKTTEIPADTKQISTQWEDVKLETATKEVRIGEMVFNVPKELEIKNLDQNIVKIIVQGYFVETINVNKRNETQEKNILISFYKDDNKGKTSLKEWLDYNGPQTPKHASIPYKEIYEKVSDINYYSAKYLARLDGANFDYYNEEHNYFSNKTDIYDIWNYRKSDEQYTKLTLEEQQSIENYEKIVDDIIKSIRFVQ